MADHYGFTDDQKEQLNELLLPENQTMWNDVLYGLGGQGDLVAVALSQVGNVGGETYWRWYVFDERVDWCAIFVSWCANECGYLENGVLPSSPFATQVKTGSKSVNNGRITPTPQTPATLFSSIGTIPMKAVKTAFPTM